MLRMLSSRCLSTREILYGRLVKNNPRLLDKKHTLRGGRIFERR
jgi:hypothetical protein